MRVNISVINEKNNIRCAFNIMATFFITLLYALSITLTPIIININKAQALLRIKKCYQNQTKITNIFIANKYITNNHSSIINIVTYIADEQIFARQIDNNNNLQNYISDAKGSVLKLNSSDKTQNQSFSYDAYGVAIINKTKKFAHILNAARHDIYNPFRYNNERFDDNTKLQYLRARFYNPEAKRFITQDSYDLLNKFNYVDSNPVISTDPTGHMRINYLARIFFPDNRGPAEHVIFPMLEMQDVTAFALTSKKNHDFVSRYIMQFNRRWLLTEVWHAYEQGKRNFKRIKVDDNSDPNAVGIKNFRNTNFSHADLRGLDLSGFNLRNVDFTRADLTGVNLSNADCSGADFRGAILRGANLSGANLGHTNLTGADFDEADLTNVNFAFANLKSTNLSGRNLSRNNFTLASFYGADVSEANFSNANLILSNFISANTRGANFTNAITCTRRTKRIVVPIAIIMTIITIGTVISAVVKEKMGG